MMEKVCENCRKPWTESPKFCECPKKLVFALSDEKCANCNRPINHSTSVMEKKHRCCEHCDKVADVHEPHSAGCPKPQPEKEYKADCRGCRRGGGLHTARTKQHPVETGEELIASVNALPASWMERFDEMFVSKISGAVKPGRQFSVRTAEIKSFIAKEREEAFILGVGVGKNAAVDYIREEAPDLLPKLSINAKGVPNKTLHVILEAARKLP